MVFRCSSQFMGPPFGQEMGGGMDWMNMLLHSLYRIPPVFTREKSCRAKRDKIYISFRSPPPKQPQGRADDETKDIPRNGRSMYPMG